MLGFLNWGTVGGTDTSAFYSAADKCIEKVLKSIAGYARVNVTALRIESGVWDTKTRAHMLLARLHAKICSSDQHSLVSRAVRMSMAALEAEEYAAPAKKVGEDEQSAQAVPWAQLSYGCR